MNNQDDKLRDLLRQWKDVEPQGNFESNVWRRIRLAEDAANQRVGWVQWWHQLLVRPALSIGVAVFVAVAIGGVTGWQSSRSDSAASPAPTPLFSFLGNDSLAGGYVHQTSHVQGGSH